MEEFRWQSGFPWLQGRFSALSVLTGIWVLAGVMKNESRNFFPAAIVLIMVPEAPHSIKKGRKFPCGLFLMRGWSVDFSDRTCSRRGVRGAIYYGVSRLHAAFSCAHWRCASTRDASTARIAKTVRKLCNNSSRTRPLSERIGTARTETSAP